jgi:hypothetical protein
MDGWMDGCRNRTVATFRSTVGSTKSVVAAVNRGYGVVMEFVGLGEGGGTYRSVRVVWL